MKRLLLVTCAMAAFAATARANNPPENAKSGSAAQPQVTQSKAVEQGSATAATADKDAATNNGQHQQARVNRMPSDPNYRWFRGRWWYWQNNGWLIWNGNRWVPHRQAAQTANLGRRSFSYEPSTNDGYGPYVPTEVGMPASDATGLRDGFNAPSSVEFQKVLPSLGIRSAGAKVLGGY